MPKSKFTITHAVLWAIGVGIIILVGVHYFPREEPGLNFLGALYYTLRLFIMEHDLTRFPESWPLVAIYFLAPVVALSALGTIITYLFRFSPALKTKFIADHVVVCGVGRTGKLMVETMREQGVTVVGIDKEDPDDFEPWCSHNKVHMIRGDFLHQPVLEKARAAQARALVFASGDDLLNLEGAVGAYEWLSDKSAAFKLIWVHIANESLAEKAREAVRTKGNIGIRFFDTYRIAATLMLNHYVSQSIAGSVQKVHILGFGKFGRDLFEMLIRKYGREYSWPIVVVDIVDRQKEVFRLAHELNVVQQVVFIHTDIGELHPEEKGQIFFVCTDDDIGNLAMALSITSGMNDSHVFVRMTRWPLPAIEDHFSGTRGITFININDLVRTAIGELPGLLAPAGQSDLKRHVGKTAGQQDIKDEN